MRIISKFHDYYDTALGYGIDKTQILKRVENEIDFKCGLDDLYWWNGGWNNNFNSYKWNDKVYFIGFCGKWYTCVSFDILRRDGFHSVNETQYIYSYDDIDHIKWEDKDQQKRFLEDIQPRRYANTKDDMLTNYLKKKCVLDEEIFRKHNASVLLLQPYKNKMIIWPRLADYCFQKV